MEPFEDEMMKILSVAAVVSLICGYIQHGLMGLFEGVSILVSILIILIVTAINDYQQEKQFQELQKKQTEATVIVKRNEKEIEIDSQELVVGDMYKLVDGSTIHADCVIDFATPMGCDESALTGEPIEQ